MAPAPPLLSPEAESFLFNQYKKALGDRLMPDNMEARQFLCFMLGFAAAKAEVLAMQKRIPGWSGCQTPSNPSQ